MGVDVRLDVVWMETDGARTEPYPGEIASVERRQDRLRML